MNGNLVNDWIRGFLQLLATVTLISVYSLEGDPSTWILMTAGAAANVLLTIASYLGRRPI